MPKTSRSAVSAASSPHRPCTPGSGGVDDEHRYRPGTGVRYGFHADRRAEHGLPDGLHARRRCRRRRSWGWPLPRRPRSACAGPGSGPGSRARTARSAPRSARSCPPSTRPARGSRPTACAGPPGARLGSATPGWVTRTYGASGCRPAATSRLGRRDLLERATEVQRAGPAARLVRPRHRAGQGEVDLAHPGAVAEPAQRVPRTGRAAGHRPWPAAPAARRRAARPGPGAGRRASAPSGRSRWPRPPPAPPSAMRVGDPGAAALDHRPAGPVGQARCSMMPTAPVGGLAQRQHRRARPRRRTAPGASSVRNRRASPAADRSAVAPRTRRARRSAAAAAAGSGTAPGRSRPAQSRASGPSSRR